MPRFGSLPLRVARRGKPPRGLADPEGVVEVGVVEEHHVPRVGNAAPVITQRCGDEGLRLVGLELVVEEE